MRQTAARAIIAMAAGIAGAGFLGLGMDLALQTVMAPSAAAAVAGAIFLVPVVILAIIPRRETMPTAQAPCDEPDTAALVCDLAALAHRKPLFTVLTMILIGAVSALSKKH